MRLFISVIQDCEDALSNWVPGNAAVRSSLSVRTRNHRNKRRQQTEGVGLEDRNSWVSAGEHERQVGHSDVEDDDDVDDELDDDGRDVKDRRRLEEV